MSASRVALPIAVGAGALVAVLSFVAGARWGARSAPPEVSGPAPADERLEEIRSMLSDVVEAENDRSRGSDVELAPVPSPGRRAMPSGASDGTLARLDEIVRRIDALERTGDVVRPGAGAPRDWREIELDVERLRRPSDQPELQRFLDRYGEVFDRGTVPLEVSLLGVREVLDRFGWPDAMLVPTDANGSYVLSYRLTGAGGDEQGTVGIYCTQFRTFYVTVDV